MFIRVLQIFETLYRQVFGQLVRAREAMAARKVEAARTALVGANARLALSPPLYRVMTTMPRRPSPSFGPTLTAAAPCSPAGSD
ncbi:MAG TPA: hypothetical protein VFY38_04525, partial [Pseudonocardia sp.]|nr:hypothetical protein [Pseudonocardia sp.]